MTHQGKNIVGERVKQARLSSKPPFTQDELSGRVAVHGVKLDRSAIAKIEGGIRLVSDYEMCHSRVGTSVGNAGDALAG